MTSRGRRAVSSLACAVVVAASAAGTLHARGLAESSSAVGAAPTQPPPTVLPVEPPPTLPPLRAPSFPAATPVWRDDFPDPAIFYEEGVYVAFGTEGDQDARLQVLLSWDLTQWVAVGDALVETPRWAEGTATWSPAPARADDGTVLLYYSARHRDLGVQCLSIARAAALDARFVDSSSGPLACDAHEGGAIDPSPFTDSDGRRYLLWKVDGASVGTANLIVAQRLSRDGMRLEGRRSVLLAADRPWEAGQIEAPSMTEATSGGFALVYSGNWYNTASYAVGAATCETPLGPCTKRRGPVLASRVGMSGPGGAEFFLDATGRSLIAYHAWPDPPAPDGERALFVDLAENLLR